MRSLKPSAALFALTLGSGVLMGSSGLAPLGLGLSLFIPALFIYSYNNSGAPLTLLASLLGLTAVFFVNREATLDVASVLMLGPAFSLLKRFGVSAAVLGGALILTAVTIFEEHLFGLPKEVKEEILEIYRYRYALYFLSSAVFSAFTYGAANWLVKELPPLTEFRLGFWTVVLFTASAVATLLTAGTFKLISVNLLLFSVGLLIVQGIAVFLWFFQRFSPAWKLIVGILIFIFPPGFFLTALILGLLDQKFNFRKLNGGKENGGNPS